MAFKPTSIEKILIVYQIDNEYDRMAHYLGFGANDIYINNMTGVDRDFVEEIIRLAVLRRISSKDFYEALHMATKKPLYNDIETVFVKK